jgi:two-component system sensor kinase FixL
MVSARAVLDRLDTEEELNSGLFRAHFEHLPGPAYIWKRCGVDFELIAHNRAALDLANGDVKDLIGILASRLFDNRPDIEEAIHRCAGAQENLQLETDLTFVSGVTRRIVMTQIPLTPDIVVVHSEDVTERRASEEALKTAERRFRALFDSHPDLVFRMDVEGKYLDMHVPEDAPLPFDPDDIVGRNMADLFGAEAAAQHRHYAAEAVRTGKTQVLEYEVSIGGREIPVESRVFKSASDEVVVNVRDISERAALELMLTEMREGGRTRIGRILQDQQAQLRRSLNDLKRVLAEAQGEASNAEEIRRALDSLEGTAEQAEALARDLCPTVPGTTIVEALTALARRSEQLHGIVCRLTHDESLPSMLEQVPDLYRIAQEAIENAVQHGEAKHVEMICTVANERFVLNVADDGTGFRLAAASDGGNGMRIMRYRAKRLNGQLTRSRRVSGGTMVTCACPVAACSGAVS